LDLLGDFLLLDCLGDFFLLDLLGDRRLLDRRLLDFFGISEITKD